MSFLEGSENTCCGPGRQKRWPDMGKNDNQVPPHFPQTSRGGLAKRCFPSCLHPERSAETGKRKRPSRAPFFPSPSPLILQQRDQAWPSLPHVLTRPRISHLNLIWLGTKEGREGRRSSQLRLFAGNRLGSGDGCRTWSKNQSERLCLRRGPRASSV